MDQVGVVDSGCGAAGPAQTITKPLSINTCEGGCQEQRRVTNRPKILRTRKGDLLLVGPSVPGSDSQAQEQVKRIKTRAEKHSTYRKNSSKNTNSVPPCNKFQKFASVIQNQNLNRPGRRKKSANQNQTTSMGDNQAESDSIHNSEASSTPSDVIPESGNVNVVEEFQLEVVLTGQTTAAINKSVDQMAIHEGSGLACYLDPLEAPVRASGARETEATIRQHMEAKKILEIQKEVGVTILQSKVEHLNRIVEMEVRDKAEKEGWEMNRVNDSSQ
ncbi:hypothetical protein P8452_12088 [Trifolium repens]|nr:hypothetical protein P8452_12088 [Trifolium repens]